jgi:cytochrome c oxidase subunit 2
MKRAHAGLLPAMLWLPAAAAWAQARWPMAYLVTHGPAADPATRLNWGLMTISALVTGIIAALVLYASLRRRPPVTLAENGLPPPQPDTGGASWIYIGTGISALVLLGSTIWIILTLSAVAAPHRPPALTLDVTGHQWWWEVRYHGAGQSDVMITANEIHIPTAEPVHIRLESDDVIHSFWVPKLGGKTDMIPGQTNFTWLQADRPGTYRGQCGEFCGPQHAHMALYVVAEERVAFDAWLARQKAAAAAPQSPQAVAGREVFGARCSVCHTVRGDIAEAGAAGRLGPDLTHLMSRATIASGRLPNNTGSLQGWVADAQAIKPGTRMPTMDLSPEDLRAVVSYLETLK